MTDLLSRRFGADRCGGPPVRCLCPCKNLLIGWVPLSLPGRMGLKCPAYPPVPHRCLPPQPDPAARNTLRDGSGGRARAAATSSTAGGRSGSGRICHLRSHHLVDRTLNECRRDRLAMSTPGGIMHQHVLVALEVAEKAADVSLKTVDAGYLAHELALRPAEQASKFTPA